MSETKVEYMMTIADDEYNKVYDLVCDLRYGKRLTSKTGQEVRFFVKDKKMYGEIDKDNKKMVQEVIPLSKVQEKKMEADPFRKIMISKLKEDYPEMKEDELDMHIDIIMEADATVKKLIMMGVKKEVALLVVQRALAEEKAEVKEMVQKMIDTDDKSAVKISPDIVEKCTEVGKVIEEM